MRVAIDMFVAESIYKDNHEHPPLGSCTLLDELARLEQENEYFIITGRPQKYRMQITMPNIRIYSVKQQPRQGILIQYQLHLPGLLEKLCPDVLHAQTWIAPIGWNGPLVITAHDLPCDNAQDPLQYNQRYRQQLLQESIRRACCIIATSEQVRAELISRWSTEKERICVIAHETDTRAQAKTMLVIYQAALDSGKNIALSRVLESKPPVTEQNLPAVSVIIPASRPEKANQALAALKAQSYEGRFETIVVGPPARALASCWPIIAVPAGPVCEPSKARNLGAAQAKGKILLFLDDDVIVAEDWVEKNVCVLQQPNVGVVGARIVGKSHAFFARCIDFTNYGHYQHRHPFDGPVASSSMGIARTIFHEVGGFNETLCSGEDIDLCYRVQKQGYRSVYRPDILVIHDHQRTTFSKLLRYNYGHGLAGGLKTKIQHRDSTLKNRLLCSLRFPLLFLLFLPAIALLATLHIVVLNIGDNKRVLLYAPFIFLGKLAYELGVFVSTLLDAFGVI